MHCGQMARDKGRISQVPDADGGVKTFLDQIDRSVFNSMSTETSGSAGHQTCCSIWRRRDIVVAGTYWGALHRLRQNGGSDNPPRINTGG